MAQLEPIDISQPKNDLSSIAEAERRKLFAKNDYKTENSYSATNPDALATGDELGKGTGGFLDTNNQNAGSITDISERKTEIKVNEYQPNKPYTFPTN
jgi:hypothetical protein